MKQPTILADNQPAPTGVALQRLVSQPSRVQLSRKKGWKMPQNTVKVARPSKYGNPHRIGFCPICGVDHTREEAVAEFEAETNFPDVQQRIREELAGKNIACFCRLDEVCHGDVLLRLANEKS
jgi:hypothetical protein